MPEHTNGEPPQDDEALTLAEAEGAELRERRDALGISVREFADRSGIPRGTIANVEAGTARGSSVKAVRAALLDLEIESGLGAAERRGRVEPLDLVEFQVTGPSSEWRVTVKGPVRDRAELEESVWRLMAKMQQQPPEE